MIDREIREGGCHCGAVRFRVKLSGGFGAARRCDCSLCAKRGAVVLTAIKGDFEIVTGADELSLYQFNTRTARHYFCSVCGIYTHHNRRSNPEELGVNAACLDGVSPFDFVAIPVNDGKRHPSDVGGRSSIVGVVTFTPERRDD